jgi:hypothetical protein
MPHLRQPGPFTMEETGRAQRFNDFISEFDMFLSVSGMYSDEQRVTLMKLSAGLDFRRLVDTLNITAFAGETKYAALIRSVRAKFSPIDATLVERFTLGEMAPLPGESTDTYLARLRRQAVLCAFACTNCNESQADDHILDILLRQTQLKGLRQRVFEKGATSLDHVARLATMMENSRRHAERTGDNRTEDNALHMSQGINRNNSSRGNSAEQCYCCGGSHGLDRQRHCPAFNKKCTACGKMSHYASVCRSSRQGAPRVNRNTTAGNARTVTGGNDARADSDDGYDQFTFTIGSSHMQAHGSVIIEGKERKLLIDTGATINVLPANFLSGEYKLKRTAPLRVFGSDKTVKPLGSTLLNIALPGQNTLKREFLVVQNGEGPAIVGLDLSLELGFLSLQPAAQISRTKATSIANAEATYQTGAREPPRRSPRTPIAFKPNTTVHHHQSQQAGEWFRMLGPNPQPPPAPTLVGRYHRERLQPRRSRHRQNTWTPSSTSTKSAPYPT